MVPRSWRPRLVCLAVVAGAVLAACGGGGGGGRSEDFSTLPTLTPTPTRPPIERPSPIEGAFEGSGVPVQKQARIATVSGGERILLGFEGGVPGYRVEYVDEVQQCGSGEPVELRGSSFLLIHLEPAQAHDESGTPTVARTEIRGFGSLVLELELVCDFEGVVAWAAGLPDVRPIAVSVSPDPPGLMIDVLRR